MISDRKIPKLSEVLYTYLVSTIGRLPGEHVGDEGFVPEEGPPGDVLGVVGQVLGELEGQHGVHLAVPRAAQAERVVYELRAVPQVDHL